MEKHKSEKVVTGNCIAVESTESPELSQFGCISSKVPFFRPTHITFSEICPLQNANYLHSDSSSGPCQKSQSLLNLPKLEMHCCFPLLIVPAEMNKLKRQLESEPLLTAAREPFMQSSSSFTAVETIGVNSRCLLRNKGWSTPYPSLSHRQSVKKDNSCFSHICNNSLMPSTRSRMSAV